MTEVCGMETAFMKSGREKDLATLQRFIGIFCRECHGGNERLCGECADLLEYAAGRLADCPRNPKPACRDCTTHCYRPDYRRRIREVMKFSGMYFVRRGRIDWLISYFLT